MLRSPIPYPAEAQPGLARLAEPDPSHAQTSALRTATHHHRALIDSPSGGDFRMTETGLDLSRLRRTPLSLGSVA